MSPTAGRVQGVGEGGGRPQGGAGVVCWAEPAARVYLALLLSIVPTGAVGWAAVRRTLHGRRITW